MISMTIDTSCLKQVVMHYVGSKNRMEPLHIATNALDLDDDTINILQEASYKCFATEPDISSNLVAFSKICLQ